MTKQVRDWNKDMEIVNEFIDGWFPEGPSNTKSAFLAYGHFAIEALPYYLQQYAAEKERADRLTSALKIIVYESDDEKTRDYAASVLMSLYPKEEEAK